MCQLTTLFDFVNEQTNFKYKNKTADILFSAFVQVNNTSKAANSWNDIPKSNFVPSLNYKVRPVLKFGSKQYL